MSLFDRSIFHFMSGDAVSVAGQDEAQSASPLVVPTAAAFMARTGVRTKARGG